MQLTLILMLNILIGLSVNHKNSSSCISDAYVNAVINAGGTPVLIPLTGHSHVLNNVLSRIDGLILSGGGDIHASFFNEELHPSVETVEPERDEYDIELVRRASERNIPILGICRGHQVINVAFGGNLIQDIPDQFPQSKINHNQSEARETGTHKVVISNESGLHTLLGTAETFVNSFHHQAVKTVADGFRAVAWSDDGLNEAIESSEGKSIVGVQWHPENMAVAENDTMKRLFNHVVEEAGLYQAAKEIHKRIYTIDSHCDTPMYFRYGINIGQNNKTISIEPEGSVAEKKNPVNHRIQVDIPKMQEGYLDATFMVAYLKQGKRDSQASQRAVKKAESILNEIINQVDKNKDIAGIARTTDDLKRLKKESKKAIFLGVENGYAIGKDLSNIQKLADKGIAYITLCHNGDNDICDSALNGNSEHNGLSEFGKEVVREMNRLGIMVDISHTSEKTSWDVLEISEFPIIASHSSVKALRNHPRNISDPLMKAIAEKGGVIQVCLYTYFLRNDHKATSKDLVDHIDYIVNTVGINHVGIGSDFDGGGCLSDVKTAGGMPQITVELLKRGYSEEDIAKIWGGNLMRVMDIVQRYTK